MHKSNSSYVTFDRSNLLNFVGKRERSYLNDPYKRNREELSKLWQHRSKLVIIHRSTL